MPSLCRDTSLQTLGEVIHDCRTLFDGYFIPSFLQSRLQRIQWSVACSTGFALQDWPHRIIHRVEIGRKWRPNFFVPYIRKNLLAKWNRRFCRMRWRPILLQGPHSILHVPVPFRKICRSFCRLWARSTVKIFLSVKTTARWRFFVINFSIFRDI